MDNLAAELEAVKALLAASVAQNDDLKAHIDKLTAQLALKDEALAALAAKMLERDLVQQPVNHILREASLSEVTLSLHVLSLPDTVAMYWFRSHEGSLTIGQFLSCLILFL